VLFGLSLCGLLVLPALGDVLVWQGDVFSLGVEVTSASLTAGIAYRIVATEVWFYDNASNLAADAMYYTTDFSNSVQWGDHFAAPGGGSFLQIDGQNVTWGPFSNGDSGNHTYTLYYTGTGAALIFKIVDWVDGYANNFCHLHVRIYRGAIVGGHVVDAVPPGAFLGFAVGAVAFAAAVTVPVVHRRRRV
jgi:hypothetical protein